MYFELMILRFLTEKGSLEYSEHKAQRVLIGRAPYCDFVLQWPEVSWEHCALTSINEKVLLSDIGSSNGTWVNGEKTLRCWIKPGDTIQIGFTTLVFCGFARETEAMAA